MQTLESFLQGASVNDMAVHDRFWAEELVYTSSHGIRYNKAELMEYLQSEKQDEEMPSVQYRALDTNIRHFNDIAIVTFTLVAKSAEEENRFFNSGVFINREGRWQALNWQATRVAQ
ncbi:nuclear transport factor 2 family protein [Aliiglaciecola sp. CAU 1673]|uniref:nuclear transport factor 2 family protein n=1 Tax=Aliiglaciecola sp. CAU 1673 TaxID=3032595 RepID=UPI0023DAE5A7|nr:nuclear transport factor 2 family protein [Aliiglaciecola sp. CAU 1673]MDF2179699.1 nuclear transport factor 2 family protein [Aliiglaciecola sp. CAU 1673]